MQDAEMQRCRDIILDYFLFEVFMPSTKYSSERGQVLVLLVLALVGLLGFTALAIDGGMVYSDRRTAQNAADASALGERVGAWLSKKKSRDYIVVQAYIEPSREHAAQLGAICAALQSRLGVATTLGYGPRFLHSTGQLHKGGPNSVLVLQIVDEPADNLAVPETNYTFDALIKAQAIGDFAALKQRRRRSLRVNLEGDAAGGLERLAAAIQE